MSILKKGILFGLVVLVLIAVCPLPGQDDQEPKLVFDDDWKLWFRVGPTVGLPMGASADVNTKLTFAYGGMVAGRFGGKIPGNWTAEFLTTESSTVQYANISESKQANFSGKDVQLLLSWQLPFTRRAGIAPYAELIVGGLIYTSTIEAQYIMNNMAYTLGYDEETRFTYLCGLGLGASLLLGTVEGRSDSRPIGFAVQLFARWLYGGKIFMPVEVVGDYPDFEERHYQNFNLGFGLQFLL